MRCAVIGSGSWGTALGIQLARSGDEVRIWSRTTDAAEAIQSARENARYLPGVRLPNLVECSSDMAYVLDGANLVVAAVPSQSMRDVLSVAADMIPKDAVVCCASKGVENGTLLTMHDVMLQVLTQHASEETQFKFLTAWSHIERWWNDNAQQQHRSARKSSLSINILVVVVVVVGIAISIVLGQVLIFRSVPRRFVAVLGVGDDGS